MKRPLLWVVLLQAGGILLAEVISVPRIPLLAALALLTLLAAGWTRARAVLLTLLWLGAGVVNSELRTSVLSPLDLRNIAGSEPHLATVQGTLLDTPGLRLVQRGNRCSWRSVARMRVCGVRLDKHDWQAAAGCVTITTAGELTNYCSGQTVLVTGVLASPKPAAAPGTFDYRHYLQRQGIYYQLSAESEADWQPLGARPSLPLADRFSTWARRALALGLPGEDESLRLEWALALGWRAGLTEEAYEPFVRAATYHIFAVDGLRMAIVFGIFFSVLRAAGLPRPACGVVLIPVVWFYVALTGWPASAVRASVMLTVVIFGWVLKRPTDALNSLFAAALIILSWDPQQLFQAGFQLSFFVVLCLILTIPPMFERVQRLTAPDPFLPARLRRRWPPLLGIPARYAGELGITSFAAWVGSLPLVAYYFNIVTPVSTPANILAVPLCVLVLISNLLSLLCAAWLSPAAELFNHAGWFIMECIRVSSGWFATWPAAYWYTKAPDWFTTLLYYALLLALVSGWLWKRAYRKWSVPLAAAGVLAWTCHWGLHLRETDLTLLPTNGGTAVYCDRVGVRDDLLIDPGSSNSVRFITQPFLRAQGANALPRLVLTHGDVQHTGGAEPVVDAFRVPEVDIAPLRFRSVVYRRTLGRLENRSTRLRALARGEQLGAWTILHPDPSDRFSKADDGTLVMSSRFGSARVLLLSDLGRAGQNTLLSRAADLQADIVVTGLPTGEEPLCEALLAAIRPRLIIVADSEFPVAQRASPKLIARLRRHPVPTLYTRETGAVTLRFSGENWELETMSGLRLSNRSPLPPRTPNADNLPDVPDSEPDD